MCRLSGLIVPLWNWNNDGEVEVGKEQWFNRTFMELKLFS